MQAMSDLILRVRCKSAAMAAQQFPSAVPDIALASSDKLCDSDSSPFPTVNGT